MGSLGCIKRMKNHKTTKRSWIITVLAHSLKKTTMTVEV